MTECFALRPQTYFYLMDDANTTIKKAKGTNKCLMKRILKFNDYKNWLINNKVILKSQQIFKNELHGVYTEEINNNALISSDDKRLQTFERITSYPYGSSVGIVCKTEILSKYK